MKNYKRYIMLGLMLLISFMAHMAVSAPQQEIDINITEEIISPAVTAEIESQPQQDSRQDAQQVTHHDKNEIELLARTIQGESMAEDYIGKVAVGAVIINRMKYRNQTMKEVIYAKNQFDSVGGRLFKMDIHEDCWNAAIDALNGENPIEEAEYFINPKHCNPNWLKNMVKVKTIGNHDFYKRKDR